MTRDADELLRQYQEQRFTTLALAEQVDAERWHAPLLSGERSIHDLLAHLLAWDEWAIAVFEISAMRALPPVLVQAVRDVDDFNARAVKRHRGISRDDVLAGLQASVARVVASAGATGAEDWADRPIPDLLRPRTVDATAAAHVAQPDAERVAAHAPTVGRIMRNLTRHEHEHAEEIRTIYGVEPHLERYQEGE